MNPWVLIGVGLGAGLLLIRKAQAGGGLNVSSRYSNAEWLARVVIMEAGSIGPTPEWAAIMFVAINRARSAHKSLEKVVSTTSWPGGGERGRVFCETIKALGGEGYQDQYGRHSPADSSHYPQALQFARSVLAGEVRNPIGSRRYFVHPLGMPSCSPEGSWRADGDRKCVNGHWLPKRFIAEYAPNPPIRVGRAIFV